MIVALLEAERIEIGVEMAAHAIGADHHQRAHESRVARSTSSPLAAVGAGAGFIAAGLAGAGASPVSAPAHSPFAGGGQSRRAQLGDGCAAVGARLDAQLRERSCASPD